MACSVPFIQNVRTEIYGIVFVGGSTSVGWIVLQNATERSVTLCSKLRFPDAHGILPVIGNRLRLKAADCRP